MALRNVEKEAALSLQALRSFLRYDPETGYFTRLIAAPKAPEGSIAGTVLPTGYRLVRVDYARFLAHRLAWFYVYGEWPEEIDHINRRKDDNRLVNLRCADRHTNAANTGARSRSEKSTKIKHLSHKRKGYVVQISRDGELLLRKSFPCLCKAVTARNAVLASLSEIGA